MGFETLAFPLLVVERETDRRQRRLAPKPPRACAIRGCSSSLLLALLWISAERDGAASTLSVQWGSLHEKQRPESLLAASANVSFFFFLFGALSDRSLHGWRRRRRRLDFSSPHLFLPLFTIQSPEPPRRTCPLLRTSTTVRGMMGI